MCRGARLYDPVGVRPFVDSCQLDLDIPGRAWSAAGTPYTPREVQEVTCHDSAARGHSTGVKYYQTKPNQTPSCCLLACADSGQSSGAQHVRSADSSELATFILSADRTALKQAQIVSVNALKRPLHQLYYRHCNHWTQPLLHQLPRLGQLDQLDRLLQMIISDLQTLWQFCVSRVSHR